MFRLVALFMCLIYSSSVFAQEVPPVICAFHYAVEYQGSVKHIRNDKVKHCILSCQIALKCSENETLMLGELKEMFDALGYGHYEELDLRANELGVEISKKVSSKEQCFSKCKAASSLRGTK